LVIFAFLPPKKAESKEPLFSDSFSHANLERYSESAPIEFSRTTGNKGMEGEISGNGSSGYRFLVSRLYLTSCLSSRLSSSETYKAAIMPKNCQLFGTPSFSRGYPEKKNFL